MRLEYDYTKHLQKLAKVKVFYEFLLYQPVDLL